MNWLQCWFLVFGFLLLMLILVWILITPRWFQRTSCKSLHLAIHSVYVHSNDGAFHTNEYDYNPSIAHMGEHDPRFLIAMRRSNLGSDSLWTRVRYHSKNEDHSSKLVFMITDKWFQERQWLSSPELAETTATFEDPRILVDGTRVFVLYTREEKPHVFPRLLEFNISGMNLVREYQFPFDFSNNAIVRHKNWSMWKNEIGEYCIHTDAYPHWRVYKVELDEYKNQCRMTLLVDQNVTLLFDPNKYPLLRCGTTWVSWDNDHWICALHTKKFRVPGIESCFTAIYETVFVLIDKKSYKIRFKTEPMCMCQEHHDAIQLATGLTTCVDKGEIFLILSMGVADHRCEFFKIARQTLIPFLTSA